MCHNLFSGHWDSVFTIRNNAWWTFLYPHLCTFQQLFPLNKFLKVELLGFKCVMPNHSPQSHPIWNSKDNALSHNITISNLLVFKIYQILFSLRKYGIQNLTNSLRPSSKQLPLPSHKSTQTEFYYSHLNTVVLKLGHISESSEGLYHPQSFWFSRSGVGPKNLHF